jgi:hypothetical protein
MAETCVRCGERPTVPGKFARRCSDCLDSILGTTPDDLNAAQVTLSGVQMVVQADVVEQPNLKTGTTDAHLEVVCAPEHDTVPPRVLRILAECGLGIRDVTPQGDPAHLFVTAR